MRILLTNDDGILAPALWALAVRLRALGEIIVVAPDREQSGVGTAVTLTNPLRVSAVPALVEGVSAAYSVEGTPADCTILALGHLIDGPVDMVISGINLGANLSNDVLISGTVGAALQGYLRGIPSVALSLASLEATNFEMATRIAESLARQVIDGSFPQEVLLNINLPDLPPEQIKGLAMTYLGARSYTDVVEEHKDGRGRRYFWLARGKPEWSLEEGSDIWAILNQLISVTPLHRDLTHHHHLHNLDGFRQRLLGELQLVAP